MAKKLLSVLISSILGLVIAPNFYTSADAFKLKQPNFAAVETKAHPEASEVSIKDANKNTPEKPITTKTNTYKTASTSVESTATKTPTAQSTTKPESSTHNHIATKAEAPANSITIAGRTIEIIDVSSTAVDAGNHVNRTGKFLYGHNSSTVFGGLKNLSTGSTFTVKTAGITKTYKVMNKVTYIKDQTSKQLKLEGKNTVYTASVMNAYDRDKGIYYDLSIMTCAGQSLGGGDATHRLVIFANEV